MSFGGAVDLVFSNLMLHHCPDPTATLSEMRRVLRIPGVLLFTTFGPNTLRVRVAITELRASTTSLDTISNIPILRLPSNISKLSGGTHSFVGRVSVEVELTDAITRQVLAAAVEGGTAVEISANPSGKELDWTCCHMASDLGVLMAISPNAHRAARLVDVRHGAEMAQAAGMTCGNILNTMSSDQLRHHLDNGFHRSS